MRRHILKDSRSMAAVVVNHDGVMVDFDVYANAKPPDRKSTELFDNTMLN